MTGAQDEVEVWLVSDQHSERVLAGLFAVLDPDERRRAESCRSQDARRRFVVAHGAVRHIVARRLGVPAGEIRWRHGPHGKPELDGRWAGAKVNLSHSGDVAMVAVTGSRRVGVDVQRVLPRLDAVAMAERYFPRAEAGLVRAMPEVADRAGQFATLWARKEALVKAHGGRLTQGLRIPVTPPGRPRPGCPAAGCPRDCPLSARPPGDGSAPIPGPPGCPPPELGPQDAWSRDYRTADVAAPAGYRAAVSLSGRAGYRVTALRWTWPGPAPS
ncbi:4'-phosphopantetheinyl transferase family protein [Streptomyces sp. NPDC049040]|uniref:4'-phosphopantetheinyl transferase family protein n=1 Tax=Streptomyces sp. NPDC049040 TaxID=3365593 RepID=UPI00371F8C49